MRKATERPEALGLGLSKLVGTDTQRIVDEATEYLLGARANSHTNSVAMLRPLLQGPENQHIEPTLQKIDS